jgi:hypothetical protein
MDIKNYPFGVVNYSFIRILLNIQRIGIFFANNRIAIFYL